MLKRFVNLSLFSLVAFLLSSCASIDKGMMSVSDAISSPDPVTGKREINLEPENKEVARATKQAKQILVEAKKSGAKVDSQLPEYRRVKRVFGRLKKVVHRRQLPWEVHVVENKSWNAFTIGGGKVFVFSGLFKGKLGVKSDDELAAILAHEMAHVTARHASERQGKLGIAMLTSKSHRTSVYQASFSTIQEDEADRYSVIYSALAGYDPSAAVSIWQRMHNASGSNHASLTHTHPLNDERARNLKRYASLAKQYYTRRVINKKHDALLQNNAVFSYKKRNGPKAGEGGGFLALLETAVNTYSETLDAKAEQKKRLRQQSEQERLASRQLLFRQLQVSSLKSGGKAVLGYAMNATGKEIADAVVALRYWSGKKLVHEEKGKWPAMQPYEKRKFGIPLKNVSFTGVTLSPVYVQLR